LTYLFLFALLLMLILLAADFKSFSLATIVMLNIPQAIIGAVLALILTRTHLNMGALVGFVALSGIAARNGILLINHWVTLMRDEGEAFGPAMLLRGCMERLTPVLMTALTTSLGLIPLVLAKGQPGKEILHPVAIVIFGGLITSTLLDFTITPAATYLFGKKSVLRLARKEDT
jgi:multidrug efflux pump subunit AcrB